MKNLYLTLVFCSIFPGFVQTQSTFGTEFWCAFMENLDLTFNDPPVFSFQISTTQTTNVSIQVPATGLSLDYVVVPNSLFEVDLPAASWYSESSEIIENKGVRIVSDNPIEVRAMHYRAYFSESTLLLPIDRLDTDYYITAREDNNNTQPSSFVITSTTDNNEIEITPSTLTFGLQPANQAFTITLNAGQTYQVQATGDLTGSRVRSLSNGRLAVFGGAQQGEIGDCNGAADSHIYDQLLPRSGWGSLYYFVPFKNQSSDVVTILAEEDNTLVYFDCNLTATLDAGETYETQLGSPLVINSNQPIAVTQFNTSADCSSSGLGDPNMLTLIPTAYMGFSTRFNASNRDNGLGFNYFSAHFVNIVMATNDVGSITLDGNNISGEFAPFPADPTLSYAQVTINPGVHVLDAAAPFQAYSYGFGEFDAYTSHLGYETLVDLSYVCLEIDVDGLFCVDSLLQFNAETDQQVVSYSWNFGDGQMSSEASPAISYSGPGTYTVSLSVTTTGGAVYTETLVITIVECEANPCDNTPPPPSIIIDGDLCAGNAVAFSYTNTNDFPSAEWDFGNGQSSNNLAATTIFNNIGVYTVNLTVFDAINCPTIITQEITVIECDDCGPPEFDILIAGDLCTDNTLFFNLPFEPDPNNPFLVIEWSASNGDLGFGPIFETAFTNPGQYTVSVTLTDFVNDCFSSSLITFEIEDCSQPCTNLPPISINASGAFCTDSVLIFSALTSAQLENFTWFIDAQPTSINEELSLLFPDPGVYTVSLEATDTDGCSYESEISFDIEDCEIDPCAEAPLTNINIEAFVLCTDSIFNIAFQTFATNFVDFTWDWGDGNSINGINSTTHAYETAGNYTITLQVLDANNCNFDYPVDVEVEDCSNVDPCLDATVEIINTSTELCLDEPLSFAANGLNLPLTNINWTFSDGQSGIGETIEINSLASEIQVNLSAIDAEGCELDDILLLSLEDCNPIAEDCELFVPNAFTPDNDGNNDSFGAFTDCPVERYNLQIYNRWGGLVFETNDISERWDGQFKSQNAPTEVYVWKVEYQFPNAEVVRLYGDLTLIR